VEAADGTAWHTYLTGRPITVNGIRNCPMGRETGIARCVWKDDWLYLADGGLLPPVNLPGAETIVKSAEVVERFSKLPASFQWLRTPHPDRLFRIDEGDLVLIGRESIGSWFEQSLVARRQEDFNYTASTSLEFTAATYQEAARVLILMSCNSQWPEGHLSYPLSEPVVIPDGPIHLSVEVRSASQQFYWQASNDEPKALGPALDAYLISDEGGREPEHSSFTGAFVGLVAFDLTGQGKRFEYTPNPMSE